jgi:hypothetical protein
MTSEQIIGLTLKRGDDGRSEGGEQGHYLAADAASIGCVILHHSDFIPGFRGEKSGPYTLVYDNTRKGLCARAGESGLNVIQI